MSETQPDLDDRSMDSSKTPLFVNLESALRKAYDGALEDAYADPDASRANEPEDPVPETIGRYRVRGVIARGGMGAVLRAEDAELGRDVAIKVSRSRDPALLRLFANEARICSQLQHPGIVPVYERGETDDARPYYVMKLVEGATLSTLLAGRPSPSSDAVRMIEIFAAVCRTMAYVHARGFFHGDLKPANIMVGPFGEVQVMDWGIAGAGADMPGTGGDPDQAPLAAGTPAYMPPERARADRAHGGIRSDVFSLGAILCEMLTGQPPYRGERRSEVFLKAANARLEEAHEALAVCGAEAGLVALARDCLLVRPEDRPADAEAVANRLADHVNAAAQRARDSELALARAHEKHAAERRARRLTLLLAAAVILGLVAGGTGFIMLGEEKRSRQAESARAVDEAVIEGRQALAAAKMTQPPDPEAWSQAEAAAVRAVGLAEKSPVDSATLERARSLSAETHALRENRLRHLAFQERIEDIEHHELEEERTPAWVDAAYRDAFEDHGIDPLSCSGDLLADDRARSSLGLSLARWALARRRATRDPRSGEDLLHAATLVDPDPDRKELCAAFLAGDHESILRASRSHERLGASPESLLLLSRFLLHLKHSEEAIAVLRAACVRHPGDFRVHHDLAAQLLNGPNAPYDEVIRLMSMCVAVRPASAHAWTDLGVAHHGQENLPAAIEALKRATRMQPDHARAWIVLALALRDAGEPDGAKDAADAAIRCAEDADGLSGMAHHFWNRGLVDAGEAALRKAVARRPDFETAKLELGAIDFTRGNHDGAVAELREATSAGPGSATGWSTLGRSLAATMNLDDARDALEKAIELGDKSAEVHLDLGRVLLMEGATERALEVLRIGAERREAARSEQAGFAAQTIDAARRAAALSSPADALRLAEGGSEDGSTVLDVARRALARGWFRTSARIFEDAFADDPDLARRARFEAAGAAAFAARGFGADAGDGGADSRSALGALAMGWMEAELERARDEWVARHLEGPRIRRMLKAWKVDPAFRPAEPGERATWTAFFEKVDALLAEMDRLVLPPGVVEQSRFTAASLGLTGPLAGAQFSVDGKILYLIANAGLKTASAYALPVERDPATGAIKGFGPPDVHCITAHADGGLAYAEDGTLYWSTWREHELGELAMKGKPKRFPLGASGVPAGGGGLAFVPQGSEAGALLLSAYADGGLYRVDLTDPVAGVRTPVPDSAKLVARVPKGIEGIRFLRRGAHAGSLLVCNWDAGCVSLLAVDETTGLPRVSSNGEAEPRNFLSGLQAPSGIDADPVTGDLIVTTWGSGNRVYLFSGLGR